MLGFQILALFFLSFIFSCFEVLNPAETLLLPYLPLCSIKLSSQETICEQQRCEAYVEATRLQDGGGAAAALLPASHDRWERA